MRSHLRQAFTIPSAVIPNREDGEGSPIRAIDVQAGLRAMRVLVDPSLALGMTDSERFFVKLRSRPSFHHLDFVIPSSFVIRHFNATS